MLANDNPDRFENDIPLSLACAAHAGTSFTPDRRGDQERASYASQLALDYHELEKLATTDEKRATLAAEFARYRAGYRKRYIAMLSAKSRCMSTMIAGPSNFPTRRNQKRSDAADKRTSDVVDFREAALAAIRKALCPELRPVMAGDADATERLEDKIAKAEAFQAQHKAINAAIRKHAKAGADAQVKALMAIDLPTRPGKHLSEAAARELLKPDFMGRIGIPSYELTNNAANIRRMKERLASVSAAKAAPEVETRCEHATIADCPADNRVRLFFPGKPSAEVRERLKSGGFRWAPSIGCWQAYRNDRTIALAKREAGTPEVEAPDAITNHPQDPAEVDLAHELAAGPTDGDDGDDGTPATDAHKHDEFCRNDGGCPDDHVEEGAIVRCPKCGTSSDDDEDNFTLCETFRAYHPFDPKRGVATNALGTTCPSEHFDDGAEDYVILCNHCTHEGSLSEFGAELKDWE